MVWDESNIVLERQRNALITESNLMQQTISSALSKEGGRERTKTINQMNVQTVPFERPIEGRDEETEEWQVAT